MTSEFALIARHFKRKTRHTLLGVGDDAALVVPTPGCELAISTDMLVAGTHFLANADPDDLGWKTLAVNLSDLAAMGAQPRWAVLALALPAATESWITRFSTGFFACADAFGIDIIGGDTTHGPRNFCVTIIGEIPCGQALRRDGAKTGDDIWVSGHPGRAARGLAHLQGHTVLDEPDLSDCLVALHRPQPRVALGLGLRTLAHAAIDISDGMLADLRHVLTASGVGATLRLPIPENPELIERCYLAGGDDYELLFTAPPEHRKKVLTLAQNLDLPITHLGHITTETPGRLEVLTQEGKSVHVDCLGYDHFA